MQEDVISNNKSSAENQITQNLKPSTHNPAPWTHNQEPNNERNINDCQQLLQQLFKRHSAYWSCDFYIGCWNNDRQLDYLHF